MKRILYTILIFSTFSVTEVLSQASEADSTLWGSLVQRVAELHQQGQLGAAIQMCEEASTLSNATFGESHLNSLQTLGNLGALYLSQYRFDDAENTYNRLLQLQESTNAPPAAKLITLRNLADLKEQQTQETEARRYYDRILALVTQINGAESPQAARVQSKIGGLHVQAGEFDLAQPLFRNAIKAFEAAGPEYKPDLAACYNNLANILDPSIESTYAETLYNKALDVQEETLGPDHISLARTLNNLAALYDILADPNKAYPLYERALQIREKQLGPDDLEVGRTVINMAALFDSNKQYDRAIELYERAFSIYEKKLGATDVRSQEIMRYIEEAIRKKDENAMGGPPMPGQ